jgi:biotin carboxyl carrier protein
MKYIITLNGKRYEVEVEKGQATAVYTGEAQPMAEAPAAAVPAQAPAPAASAASAAPAAPAGAGEPVKAPMPGTILSVSCTKGQAVKSGQVLLVLEAMKMENEITAPRDGTITAVCVTKGSTVETGSVLCTLE